MYLFYPLNVQILDGVWFSASSANNVDGLGDVGEEDEEKTKYDAVCVIITAGERRFHFGASGQPDRLFTTD